MQMYENILIDSSQTYGRYVRYFSTIIGISSAVYIDCTTDYFDSNAQATIPLQMSLVQLSFCMIEVS